MARYGHAYEEMVEVALRQGESVRSSRNRALKTFGKFRRIHSFVGPIHVLKGTIVATCYWSQVLAVDFERSLITDFGMRDRSITTGQHIHGWEDALVTLLNLPREARWGYSRWTRKDSHLETYAQRMPFCVRRNETNWFHWPSFEEALVEPLDEGARFLRNDQNWRYYEYAWNEEGRWSRRFKNEDAERRWHQRNRFRARKAA